MCESPPGNNPLDTYTLTVAQTGNDLDRSERDRPPVAGTISGDQMTWSGNVIRKLGGTTTINSATATVAADCNDLSGSFTWTHVQPTLYVHGYHHLHRTEPAATGCGA